MHTFKNACMHATLHYTLEFLVTAQCELTNSPSFQVNPVIDHPVIDHPMHQALHLQSNIVNRNEKDETVEI